MSTRQTSPPSSNLYGPPDRWFILTLVSLNYFVLYLHRSVIGFIQNPLIDELGLTEQEMGWLQPAFIVPYALSQLFVAYLGDRFRRRTILIISLTSSVIFLAAMGLSTNFQQLCSCRILLGFAQAASVPAIAGIMADCFTQKNRSTAVSIYLFSFSFSVLAAGKFGGKLADIEAWTFSMGGQLITLSGWRLAHLGFSLFGAIIVVLLIALLREPERTEREPSTSASRLGQSWLANILCVLKTPSFLLLGVIFILFSCVTNTREFWLARYFHDSFHMSLSEAGQFSTLWIQTATFVGTLMGGFTADRWSRKWQGGRGALSAIGMALWIPALYVIGTSDSMLYLRIAMVAWGWGLGIYTANLWTTTFDVVDPAVRSTATGMLNVFAFAPGFCGPVVGYLKDHAYIDNYGTVFQWLSLFSAANVILFAVYIWVTLPKDYRNTDS